MSNVIIQTTRIAWITHHLPVEDTGGGKWLPGHFRGGAEMSDDEYRQAAPPWIGIDTFHPDNWELALGYDRIVITGTDLLSEQAMIRLAEEKPMVFVHHEQTETPARKILIESANPFVCHTPAHLQREQLWCDIENYRLVLSHFDTSECVVSKKQPYALWAARNHPQKGMNQARLWAHSFGIPLVRMYDYARSDVLDMMSRAEWFVHVPLSFESECRSVMEAVLSGCRVHTNKNVGIVSMPRWDDRIYLGEQIDMAGEAFWDAVL